jgi:hypothetical protein
MAQPYLILPRGIWKDSLFADKPFSEREAWLWMWEHASFKASEFRHKNALYPIRPGQLPTSYLTLAAKFRWSRNKLRPFIALLQQTGKIRLEKDTPFLLITICDYCEMQNVNKEEGQQKDQQQDTGGTEEGQQMGPNRNKVNKVNKDISAIASQCDQFYLAFPRKEKRGDAEKAFPKALQKTSFEKIMVGVRVYSAKVAGEPKKFIRQPATWLNSESWHDEPPEPPNAVARASAGYTPLQPGGG